MIRALGRTFVDPATARVTFTLPERAQALVQNELVACTLRRGVELEARALDDGRLLWETRLPRENVQLSVDGGHLYASTIDALFSFRLVNGERRELFRGSLESFVAHGDRIAVRHTNGAVSMIERDGGSLATLMPSFGERLTNGTDRLVEGSGECVAILVEAMARVFVVRGLGRKGDAIFRTEVTHSEVLSQDSSSGTYYYLHFEQVARHHLLFTSHWSSYRRPSSVVLKSSDGAVAASLERHVSAMVEHEEALAGLLAVDPVRGNFVFFEPAPREIQRWGVAAPSAMHRRADAAWSDRGLLIAQYDAIGPGAHLVMVNPASGAAIWRAEVEARPSYERTPLFVNAWGIAVDGERVVLIGDESVGSSVQIFELATGQRVYSDLSL